MENLSDTKCVLFQFLNENNVIKVGFRAFLQQTVSDGEIERFVGEEKVVAVKWPICEIGPASKMKKRLACSPEFEFKVAKIIAFGKYSDMITQRINMEKFNTLQPTRSMRGKRHMKKFNSFLTPAQEKEKRKKQTEVKSQKQPKRKMVESKQQGQELLKEIIALRGNKTQLQGDFDLQETLKNGPPSTQLEIETLENGFPKNRLGEESELGETPEFELPKTTVQYNSVLEETLENESSSTQFEVEEVLHNESSSAQSIEIPNLEEKLEDKSSSTQLQDQSVLEKALEKEFIISEVTLDDWVGMQQPSKNEISKLKSENLRLRQQLEELRAQNNAIQGGQNLTLLINSITERLVQFETTLRRPAAKYYVVHYAESDI